MNSRRGSDDQGEFPFKISSTLDTNDDVAWCREHIGIEQEIWFFRHLHDGEYAFYFKEAKHAVEFKLRFG